MPKGRRDGLHYRIVRGSGNRRLIGILYDDLSQMARMCRRQLGMGDKPNQGALEEHARIVDAIAARDGELAAHLMRRHIRASRRKMERRLIASH